MTICLEYLNISELDALVEARIHAARRKGRQLESDDIRDLTESIRSTDSSSYSSLKRRRDLINHNKGLP